MDTRGWLSVVVSDAGVGVTEASWGQAGIEANTRTINDRPLPAWPDWRTAMLKGQLTHPTLIGALAAAGHGSKVLIADGNYPHSTGAGPRVPRVYLNLRAGLPTVDDVLEVLVQTVPIEAAAVMIPAPGEKVPAHDGFRKALDEGTAWTELGRFEFYEACRSDDMALVIATGEQRTFANVLLTIGVRISD